MIQFREFASSRPTVFIQFRVFSISTSVDITVYQYKGKNVLYFFYNIAQRTSTEIFEQRILTREIFCVDIELYQHGS